MFFPCKQFDKAGFEKVSALRSVFYFFAREEPESALIQLIFSLTSVDMDEA